MELVDVNGDKREDLLLSCGDVFLRQTDGTLAENPSLRLTPPAGEPQGWAFMGTADFDKNGSIDVALLARVQDGTAVWLYSNTGSPTKPFLDEPSEKFVVGNTVVNRDGPTVADFNGDGTADLILTAKDKPPGVRVLLGSPSVGLNPKRIESIELDYVPHYDTRLGAADFNGDGRVDLAGFGPSAVGAVGVYVWLQGDGG